MEFNKKQPALLYLDKNGFYFFEEGLTSVISLAFADESVRNLDVINSTSLSTQIKTFIDQYQIQPAAISIVLSPNVTFEKDITGLTQEQQEEAVKQFIDTIPFDSVLSRSYPIDNGTKVIGCNEDLFLELKNAFVKNSFSVEHIIPYQLMGADQSLIKNLTADTASQFIKRVDHLKQFTLFVETKVKEKTTAAVNPQTAATTSQTAPVARKTNTRLFAMIGIFVVLFAILGFMLINMGK